MAKHDCHWTFGNKVHISFPNGGDPVNEPNHAFNSNEGCATYSDVNGDVLFYTDGTLLYNPANVPINTLAQPLGGNSSSAHSAIIVPPAGGGSRYHVFTVPDAANAGQVSYTPVAVAGSTVSLPVLTVALPFGPKRAAEKLAAIPHTDCNKYWVVSLDVTPTAASHIGTGTIYAMLVDSDAGPTAAKTVSQPYPYPVATLGFCIKFSPDGKLLAVTTSPSSVDILAFNRTTGAFTAYSQIDQFPTPGIDGPYGVEFSPSGKYLYFSGYQSGYVRRYTIPPLPSAATPFSGTQQVGLWSTPGALGNYTAGALQLAPNGKIYGTKVSQNTLFEIGLPDSPTATSAGVAFLPVATQAGGGPLTLNGTALLGLPTFTRIADDCLGDRCARLAHQVNEQLAQIPKINTLRPCDKEQPVEKPPCRPIEMPRIAPWTSIRWGDSPCDCIEGDDTEMMLLTVCNPYSNLTLSNLTIHQLVVVDANGNPPPLLPDGSPSVQLVPVGPYCFDDLAPCTCVTRQFVLRLRGAVPGTYRILVRGICFDACFHGDEEDCFLFEVCKD